MHLIPVVTHTQTRTHTPTCTHTNLHAMPVAAAALRADPRNNLRIHAWVTRELHVLVGPGPNLDFVRSVVMNLVDRCVVMCVYTRVCVHVFIWWIFLQDWGADIAGDARTFGTIPL